MSLLLLIVSGAPGALDGQDPDARLGAADSLFSIEGDAASALAEVEGFLTEHPDEYRAAWKAASYAVALGVMAEAEGDREEAERWYRHASRRAAEAIALRPAGTEGRYWRVAVLGRRALEGSRRERAVLADSIRAGALAILADDPEHAGAHNALGRLYHEIMTLSRFTRAMGRTFADSRALDEADWTLAERHLRRAVALDPDMAMYRLDLGRFLAHRGDAPGARTQLGRVASIPDPLPPERVFRDEARALLAEVGG